jgi:hypothetical protein
VPRLVRLPPLLVGEGGPLAEAVARGEVSLLPVVTDLWLQRVAHGQEHLAALRELGARSAIVAPLAARGQTLGLLSFWTAERELRQDDAGVARELGRVVSLAIELARLHRAAQKGPHAG